MRRVLSISVPSSSGNSLQRREHCCQVLLWRHFSPLFIGELSSTRNAVAQHRKRGRFQSPLHRGTLFNSSNCAKITSGSRYFSPLFIGELSSTDHGRAGRRLTWSFQSPLHRGTLFNGSCGGGGGGGSYSHFSPLFIGELSSTCHAERSEASQHLGFQSPLHRGTLFNRHGRGFRGHALNHISVPSSSGNSLQPLRTCEASWIGSFQDFSPLFIGELSSTFFAANAGDFFTYIFQSPLHRGTLFNRVYAD